MMCRPAFLPWALVVAGIVIFLRPSPPLLAVAIAIAVALLVTRPREQPRARVRRRERAAHAERDRLIIAVADLLDAAQAAAAPPDGQSGADEVAALQVRYERLLTSPSPDDAALVAELRALEAALRQHLAR